MAIHRSQRSSLIDLCSLTFINEKKKKKKKGFFAFILLSLQSTSQGKIGKKDRFSMAIGVQADRGKDETKFICSPSPNPSFSSFFFF